MPFPFPVPLPTIQTHWWESSWPTACFSRHKNELHIQAKHWEILFEQREHDQQYRYKLYAPFPQDLMLVVCGTGLTSIESEPQTNNFSALYTVQKTKTKYPGWDSMVPLQLVVVTSPPLTHTISIPPDLHKCKRPLSNTPHWISMLLLQLVFVHGHPLTPTTSIPSAQYTVQKTTTKYLSWILVLPLQPVFGPLSPPYPNYKHSLSSIQCRGPQSSTYTEFWFSCYSMSWKCHRTR